MPTIHGAIKRDMRRIGEALTRADIEEIKGLLREFRISYSAYWKDLNFITLNGWFDDQDVANELKGFRGKLETLLPLNPQQLSELMNQKSSATVINSNQNTSNVNIEVNINALFQDINAFICENPKMNAVEKKEAQEVVDKLKDINNSEDSKEKKWEKIKPILIWLSNKGIDIVLKTIPIILKILTMNGG